MVGDIGQLPTPADLTNKDIGAGRAQVSLLVAQANISRVWVPSISKTSALRGAEILLLLRACASPGRLLASSAFSQVLTPEVAIASFSFCCIVCRVYREIDSGICAIPLCAVRQFCVSLLVSFLVFSCAFLPASWCQPLLAILNFLFRMKASWPHCRCFSLWRLAEALAC